MLFTQSSYLDNRTERGGNKEKWEGAEGKVKKGRGTRTEETEKRK